MSGAPWPDPSHECAGGPILDALTHQAIKTHPRATMDEIIEEVLRIADYRGNWSSYDRRMAGTRVREIGSLPNVH